MTGRDPSAPRTLVVQSFRRTNVAPWITRCLDNVRKWAELRGFVYAFFGDEFYDLCGPEYLARVGGNPRSITNLARLEITRIKLAEGYDEVIWFDADVFIFDPEHLVMQADAAGYAFGREVWVTRGPRGGASCLERMIGSNFQVGVRLLSGPAYSMAIPVINCVGMFSPELVEAIAADDRDFMRAFARAHGHKTQAANLGWSLSEDFTEQTMMAAMDRLESSAGSVLNDFLDEGVIPVWRRAPRLVVRRLVSRAKWYCRR